MNATADLGAIADSAAAAAAAAAEIKSAVEVRRTWGAKTVPAYYINSDGTFFRVLTNA
jgi:hypothetical protein